MQTRFSTRISALSVLLALPVLLSAPAFNASAGQPPTLKPKAVSPPPQKTEPKQNPAKDDKSHHVKFKMDHGTSLKNISTGLNFEYTDIDEKLVVTGKKATYYQKSQVMDLEGAIVLDDEKHHVTGDKAHIDDSANTKLGVFTGNVVIVLKPKTDVAKEASNSEKQRGKGATITCDKVQDYYKKEFVILTGHFTVKQLLLQDDGTTVERTLTADHAEYDGKANSLHLFGPVDATDTLKPEIHWDEDVFVGTKEGEESLKSDGKSEGKVLKKQDEEKPAGPPQK